MALAITARSSLPVTLFMNRNRTLVAANRRATAGSIGRRMPGIAISSPAWSQPQVRGRPRQFPREVDQPNTMAMAHTVAITKIRNSAPCITTLRLQGGRRAADRVR